MESLEQRIVLANELFAPGLGANNVDVIGQLNFAQFKMDSTDELRIQLGGTVSTPTFDQVKVTGSSQLAGLLRVSLLNGLDPNVGATFQVVDSVGSSGAFDTLELPTLSNGKRLVPVASPSGLTLMVAEATRPTGGSQLRLPNVSGIAPFNDFLKGLNTTITFAGLDLTVLGQQVRGDFTLRVGSLNNAPILAASATNVSASLGGDLITLSNGNAQAFLSQ